VICGVWIFRFCAASPADDDNDASAAAGDATAVDCLSPGLL